MNQRANSVADLAAVLFQAEAGPSQQRVEHKERSRKHWDRVKQQKEKAGKEVPKRDPHLATETSGVEGVMIRWADILDAEYAKQWPKEVVHHTLERHRYTAAFPAYEIKDQDSLQESERALEPPEAPPEAGTTASSGTG